MMGDWETYEGQSTGTYVPLGRESTIVDMLSRVLPRQALLRVWSDELPLWLWRRWTGEWSG